MHNHVSSGDAMTGEDGDIERRVREYVLAVFPDLARDCVTQVRRLDAGENHDVYRLSMLAPEGTDVVVRIATSERARDCEMAEREAQVLEEGARCRCASPARLPLPEPVVRRADHVHAVRGRRSASTPRRRGS